jgi:hypothetical protein
MNTAKEYIHNLINELSEKETLEVLEYIEYIKSEKMKEEHLDLQNASQSSISFWDNQTDDEVWNNV